MPDDARKKRTGGAVEAVEAEAGGSVTELSSLVERLCARCEALNREARELRAENRRLRARGSEAKTRLERLLLSLPRE